MGESWKRYTNVHNNGWTNVGLVNYTRARNIVCTLRWLNSCFPPQTFHNSSTIGWFVLSVFFHEVFDTTVMAHWRSEADSFFSGAFVRCVPSYLSALVCRRKRTQFPRQYHNDRIYLWFCAAFGKRYWLVALKRGRCLRLPCVVLGDQDLDVLTIDELVDDDLSIARAGQERVKLCGIFLRRR
jgi:hypothetical protein